MRVTAAADFLPVASELGELAARYAERGEGGPPAGAPARAWAELTSGGWLGMGLEVPGGPGLLELAEAARAWGAHLVPVPFITTMLGCRWRGSADLAAGGQAMTWAISTPAGAMAPFAGWPGIDILEAAAAAPEDSAADDATPASAPRLTEMPGEDFAPSLAAGICDAASQLSPQASRELATLWAAETIGGAQDVLDRSVAYAKQRSAYGHLIGSYQAVAHLLAEMHRDTQFGWSAVVWAAQGGPDAVEAARAAIGLATDVIRGGIQVHGGIGFTWDLGLHRYLRHAIALAELTAGLAP
jgi:alkylation response protein AidB-like acyl-CoA dehydrogenase